MPKNNGYNLIEKGENKYISLPQINLKTSGYFFGTHNFNKITLFESINNLQEKELITVKQIHGTNTLIIKDKISDLESFRNNMSYNGYDAIISNQKDLIIGIYTADCIPILLYDQTKNAVAAIHAGWRGSVSGICIMTVNQMIEVFGSFPEDILAIIGPGIGQCCYEVGEDVANQVRYKENGVLKSKGSGKYMFDLKGFNIKDLLSIGINKDNIHDSKLCTHCLPELFPSYRRDGKGSGRILSGIYIK